MGMPTRARRSMPKATFSRSPARFASSKATPSRYPHRFPVMKPVASCSTSETHSSQDDRRPGAERPETGMTCRIEASDRLQIPTGRQQ
jgi:hypothetical protein